MSDSGASSASRPCTRASRPYEALAIYAIITYMDTVNGVFVPDGGMHALPTALADAALGAGVKFRYGTRVERILLRHGSSGPVIGVRLEGGEHRPGRRGRANPDLPVAYRTLLPGLDPPRATRRGRYSPSAVVWHVGVRARCRPASSTTTSTSGAAGTARSGR